MKSKTGAMVGKTTWMESRLNVRHVRHCHTFVQGNGCKLCWRVGHPALMSEKEQGGKMFNPST